MLNFSEAGGASPITVTGYGTRTQVRPAFLRVFAIALLLFCAGHLYTDHFSLPTVKTPTFSFVTTASKAPAPTVSTPTPVPTPAPVNPAPAAVPVSAPAIVAPPAPSVPNCTPANYVLPSQIDLTNAATGLTQVVDTPQYYTMYGISGSQITQQISNCAPHVSNVAGTYAAYTSYVINWQYSYTDNGIGMCTLSDAKIGVHINQIFPKWQSNASANLTSQWQAFMSGLVVHEQGHVALNEQYAQTMLNQLQNFPATSCSTVSAAVNAQMNGDLTALNNAHQAYENQTNYGATQGAIVP